MKRWWIWATLTVALAVYLYVRSLPPPDMPMKGLPLGVPALDLPRPFDYWGCAVKIMMLLSGFNTCLSLKDRLRRKRG